MTDLRFAVRMLLKQPSFSAIVVLTLALGIGATAAVFSLIQGVLLTTPPYPQPERVVLIAPAREEEPQTAASRGWPAGQWLEWQKQAGSFEAIAPYSWAFQFLILPGSSQSLEGMAVTPAYFRVTGLQPILGRSFTEAECGSAGAPVVLLGYELWRRQFQGDASVLGKTLRMSGMVAPPVVIGVMPPGVRFLPSPGAGQEPNYNVDARVDFWMPAASDPARLKEADWDVAGRLRAGVTLSEARTELGVLVQRESQADRELPRYVPRVQPLTEEMNRDGGRILIPLLGAAALVLLIACGNAGALLLVRGLQRRQEYAVRTALGVTRFALFRRVAAESLVLALPGGAFGVGLAFAAVRLFRAIGGHAVPRLDAVTMGWPVLAWGLGCAVFAALLAGIYPALRAARLDPAEALKATGPRAGAGREERRFLRVVTMLQTALTLALLVGAGLLIRTMVNLSKVPPGYETAHILTMTVTAVQGDWSDFHHRALQKVSELPGVREAAFAWGLPLTGNNWPGRVEIEGQPAAGHAIQVPLRSVTPGYFHLLGVAITEGRDFRSGDDSRASRVAVVNQAFRDRYFSHTGTLGKRIRSGGPNQPPVTIVGVVGNGRTADLTRAAEPEIYFPLWQEQAFSKDLVVRTAGHPGPLLPAVQRALRSVDPTVATENARTFQQIRNDSVASRTFAMQLLMGFAAIGTFLSLVGIYGVLSLSVASRRREFAIRSAVGAGEREVRRLVFAEGLRLAAGGVPAGILAAVVLARALRSFLFDVRPADPLTLAAVAVLFAAMALLACRAPARRAAEADPMEALRSE